MFRTLIADTVDGDGGDRGLLLVVALVALGLVVAGLRRRGGSGAEAEEEDAIDRIEVSADEERGSADTSGSGIDRVSDEEDATEGASEGESGSEEDEDEADEEDLTVEVTDTVSRFGDIDAVDWVMVLAAGVRAMREELETRRGD